MQLGRFMLCNIGAVDIVNVRMDGGETQCLDMVSNLHIRLPAYVVHIQSTKPGSVFGLVRKSSSNQRRNRITFPIFHDI